MKQVKISSLKQRKASKNHELEEGKVRQGNHLEVIEVSKNQKAEEMKANQEGKYTIRILVT